MPDPSHILRIYNDKFTPVRALDGTLLGVVPRVPDTAELLRGSNGASFELRIAAQVCVCVNPEDPLQSPMYLDGFISVEGAAQPAGEASGGGEDPDLAVGV